MFVMINSWMFSKVSWVCLWWFADLGFVIFSLISVDILHRYLREPWKGLYNTSLEKRRGQIWIEPDARCEMSSVYFLQSQQNFWFSQNLLMNVFCYSFLRMFLCHIKADHLIDRFMGCVMMGRSGLTNFLNKMARF